MGTGNKLTDTKIRNLKPIEGGPQVKRYADGHGLNFVVTRAGGRRWEYRFRFEGKWQTLTLGTYPLMGLADAREKHLTAMKKLKAGLNPAAEKQAEREEALTLEMAALAFLEYKRENGDSSEAIKGIENRLKRHIFPALGSRPLSIDPPIAYAA